MPVDNLGLVDVTPAGNALFRSAQPTPDTIPLLQRLRIKSIIKLNADEEDELEWGKPYFDITYKPLPERNFSPDFLTYLIGFVQGRLSLGNVLVHCRMGRHRTGLLVAAWRIRDNHWTIAQAKAERDLYDVDAEPPFDEDKMLAEFAEHANA
jgi:protein tyrosine/serine phosphatase